MHSRIRKAREDAGYTREKFAELIDVIFSYMAVLERGITNVSVKTLIKICKRLGLNADYILFGDNRDSNKELIDKLCKVDPKYLPLIDSIFNQLLAISE